MNVRLICMDMDGTLFAEKESIPDKNIYALRRCAERGIHLALVSGRGNKYLQRVVERIGVSCAIASANGARIDATENGPTIFEGKFAEDEGKRIFKVLYALNVNFEVYTRELNYVIRPEKIPERHRESLMRTGGMKDCVLLYDEESALKSAEIGAYKYVAFSDDPTEIECVRNALDANGITHCSSGSRNVEIMPTGIGKGNAVKVLAAHFGVPVSETMAFGDYTNDTDMLNAAGHPVAMANGVESLKRIAELIAPRNTEGGVGETILKYVLEEEMP